MTERDYLDVKSDPDTVFSFLADLSDPTFKIKSKDPSSRQIFFSTGVSLFSWGENIEVTVLRITGGSRVLVRGQGKFQLNLTANPRDPIDQIVSKLKERFEIIS